MGERQPRRPRRHHEPRPRADAVVGFEVALTLEGPLDAALSGQVREHLLATVREALTNVGKHAHATHVSVHVAVDETSCTLTITDDGVGMTERRAPGAAASGCRTCAAGPRNCTARSTSTTPPDGGTVLEWKVPLGA